MIVTLAKTISIYNSSTGVIGIDISLETLTKMINQTKLGNSGFAFLLDQNGHYMIAQLDKTVTNSQQLISISQETAAGNVSLC